MSGRFPTLIITVSLSVFLCGAARGHVYTDYPSLPVIVPETEWRALGDCEDGTLGSALESSLAESPRFASLIADGRIAVGLVDLSRANEPRFATINGDLMMYAASLPKIAISLAAFDALERGTLQDSQQLQTDLHDMIRVSSNAAATRTIDRVGLESIEATVTDPRFNLFDAGSGGGLWVGKRYAKDGERNPDPLKGLSHAATARQVCRFYYLLATGKLINAERSRQMLATLADPGHRHKFVRALETTAPDARVYRKSGTWKQWHSDSVLVWGPGWRRYVLVGLVEHPEGGRILETLLPAVEEVLRPAPTVAGATLN